MPSISASQSSCANKPPAKSRRLPSVAQDYLIENFDRVLCLIRQGARVETLFRNKDLKIGSVTSLCAMLKSRPDLSKQYDQAIKSRSVRTCSAQGRIVEQFDAVLERIEAGEGIQKLLLGTFGHTPAFYRLLAARPDLDRRYRRAMRRREAGSKAIGKSARFSDHEVEAAIDRVVGMSPRGDGALYAQRTHQEGPTLEALKTRVSKNVDLDRRLSVALAERKQHVSASPLKRSIRQNQFYAVALAAMPKGLDPDIKDDVISDLVLAMLEGDITIEEVAMQAKEFIAQHFRRFSSRQYASLDQPVFEDGAPLIDTLTADKWMAA